MSFDNVFSSLDALYNFETFISVSDDVQAQKPHRSRIRHHKGSSYKLPSRSQSCDSHSKGSVSSSRCKMVSLGHLLEMYSEQVSPGFL